MPAEATKMTTPTESVCLTDELRLLGSARVKSSAEERELQLNCDSTLCSFWHRKDYDMAKVCIAKSW